MKLAARDTPPQPYVVPPSKQFDGNDGAWSTFDITVGTPGQGFRVLPSTKGAVTYVIAPDGCRVGEDPPGCQQDRGIQIFQSDQNIGFQSNMSSSWNRIGAYTVDLESALGITSPGDYGMDTIGLGPAAGTNVLSVSKQIVAQIAVQNYFLGVFPLGQADQSFNTLSEPVPSLLNQMRNSSMIPSLSYAYTAGGKYQAKSVFGSLILGGYDSTRFKPNAEDFSFDFSDNPSELLKVAVGSISASNTLQGEFSFTSSAYFSVIDTTVSQLWLPQDVCKQFETAFGLTYDPTTDLYLVNDTIHTQLRQNNPTITIKLANSLTATTSNFTNIQLPYAAFDLQASYPYYTNETKNYFPIRRAQNDSQYVLGRTLLQEAYLIVDYERGNFTVAQASYSESMPAPNIVTIKSKIGSSDDNSSSGLSTGAIVGIVIGGVAALALIIGAIWFFRRRRSRARPHELGTDPLSDSASGQNLTTGPAAMKQVEPQELSGTPMNELASPHRETYNNNYGYPVDTKTVITPTSEPQELHAESRTPVTARWEEVRLPPRSPMRAGDEDDNSTNRSISQVPSDDGWSGDGPRSGVSPLTGHFGTLNMPKK